MSSSLTLNAIAYMSGMTDSAVASGIYAIQTPAQVASPTFSVPAGTYSSTQLVTISTSTAGAAIRYTTDGSTPSSTVGAVYSGPVSVSSSETLTAVAYMSGMTNSGVASAVYKIQAPGQVASPTFSVPAGTYSSTQLVAISTGTAGAAIRYTTDGSTPSSTVGTVYSGPVSVSSSLTLNAIAYISGMTNSGVASASYTIQTVAQVATPSFAPPGGSYTSPQSVSISTSTAGAAIRYTTDGSTPSSTVGTVYSGPVSVSGNLTLKAVAYKSGMTDSTPAAGAYIISFSTTGGGTNWYSAAWSHRKTITVDHTKVSGTANLTSFPMLFSVTDLSLRTVSNGGAVGKADGTDLVFTASDGVTKLDYELESYNGSTGQVNAWVRLPALSPTTDSSLYVYYGNTSAGDQQNTTGVWDSNYKLVWHLGNGTTLSGADSTSNQASGGLIGSAVEGVGKIGGGAAGVVEGTLAGVVSGDATRTLECWFRITNNTGSDQVICGMGHDSGTGTIFSFVYRNAGSKMYLDAGGIKQTFNWSYDSNWHHVAVSYTSGSGLQNAAIYLDGVLKSTSGQRGTLATPATTSYDVQRSPAYPGNDMKGIVDEFRVSNSARSAAWIVTEFNNQNLPGTFLRLGPQE